MRGPRFPPIEPPPCRWALPDPLAADADGICGVGADLAPGTLLAGYRRGLFPMHLDRKGKVLGWWSPDPRGVLALDGLKVSRSLRKSLARYEIRVDTAFEEVIAACAAPRPGGGHWIHRSIVAAYTELHRLGWAHSVEAWHREATTDRLAGGLYGVAVGGLFAGESMFYRATDASKAALVGLVEVLSSSGDAAQRLVDVQWSTPHLASLGVVEVPVREYLRRLDAALELDLPACWR